MLTLSAAFFCARMEAEHIKTDCSTEGANSLNTLCFNCKLFECCGLLNFSQFMHVRLNGNLRFHLFVFCGISGLRDSVVVLENCTLLHVF
jgi:hypothetical protein